MLHTLQTWKVARKDIDPSIWLFIANKKSKASCKIHIQQFINYMLVTKQTKQIYI